MAARRAKPIQRGGCQGLRGNPDACRPGRGSACSDDHYGAPAEAQRSGFGGERRHSGGNELCRLRRSERSVTCADEAGGDARPLSALFVQPAAAMSPRFGGSKGRSPWPFFPPISLGRNGGAVVGPSCGSFASGQARKLIPSAGPPLPTTTTPLGRRGGPIGRVPGGTPADGRPQVAPTNAGG